MITLTIFIIISIFIIRRPKLFIPNKCEKCGISENETNIKPHDYYDPNCRFSDLMKNRYLCGSCRAMIARQYFGND